MHFHGVAPNCGFPILQRHPAQGGVMHTVVCCTPPILPQTHQMSQSGHHLDILELTSRKMCRIRMAQTQPGSMSYIIQIRDLSALKHLDHQAGIERLSKVRKIGNTALVHTLEPRRSTTTKSIYYSQVAIP